MMVTAASSFPSFCFVSRLLKQKHVDLKFLVLLPNFVITRRSLCSTPSATCFPRFPNPTSVVPRLLPAVSPSSISHCQIIHSWKIKSGNYGDLGFFGDRLVVAYAKFGRLDYALNLFEEIPHKDLVSWNSMISVFSQRGSLRDNLDILRRMRSEAGLVPNVVTLISVLPACAAAQALDAGEFIHGYAVKLGFWSETKVVNSLINMYGKCGSVHAACRLFQAMPSKTLVSWNTMVMIHAQNGFVEGAIDLFNSMRRASIKPDRVTVVALLQSCADLAAERTAKAIHGCIMTSGFNSDVAITTALIIAYAKSGKLDVSHDVFHELKTPDMIAWTAMLAGYATHGHGKEAITIFNLMIKEGLKPDHVTFTHVLSACSHSGLVSEGKKYFEAMSNVYGVEPRVDHYSCMVDLLGRSGLLEEACELIQSMPINPNAAVWGALLGACRIHNNIELGKEVAERLFEIDPLDPRNYIILSNMYSAAGLWTDASRVRALMKDKGLKKSPACSFIEHGNKIHRFVVDDCSHPESEKIHARLEELIEKICQIGFVPKTELVLHDVDEEVKEGMINKHSEKLAIAFGLLVKSEGMPIMITNNLRICGDCHSAAKFMSLIEKCVIVIRDSKRFHHFADGFCSCGDYW
ncbi:pentatricopeptide repeat-containing protein At5g40410, mitochondrial [Macadamia integrifolia]|uniref:pentatricopeptide repeat-containing protein At5g40410, mitochondrial n=1 Tax=Macadamia integrifolia TaxID=60698 RepID=UPI001C4F48BC|nr:pentatricopeptide repeat-containing protein At5g40410, mitochondrial [Macadamia integrifolia]